MTLPDPIFAQAGQYPSAKTVDEFHRNADTDRRPESIHHTLGLLHNQAAFGNHTHNGSDSALILDKTVSFAQNLGTPQGQKDAIKQILTVLATLGAVDLTTVSGTYPIMYQGSITFNFTASINPDAAITVNFPAAFPTTPRVWLQHRVNSNVWMHEPHVTAVSTTAFTATAQLIAAASVGATVDWIAAQQIAYT